jgi:hypothetical protein
LDDQAEKRAIDAVAQQFFSAFTNKDGRTADLSGLHELFFAGGVIVKTCGGPPQLHGLADFIGPRRQLLNDGELVDFCEEELWSRTDVFGDMAQRFCAYQKSGVLSGKRFETKGMKSIQLVNTETGWKIVSVAWDDERDGVSLQR